MREAVGKLVRQGRSVTIVFAKAIIRPSFGKCDAQVVHCGSTPWLHGGHNWALAKTLSVTGQ
jgi:hypothetical protein